MSIPQQPQYIAPTAWQSLPPLIRFAAWVWAVGTVLTLGVGWLIVVLVWGLS